MGASGGAPHALACGALLGDRVSGVVTLGGIAPLTEDFDWFAGMKAPGGLPERAAVAATARRSHISARRLPAGDGLAAPVLITRQVGAYCAG